MKMVKYNVLCSPKKKMNRCLVKLAEEMVGLAAADRQALDRQLQ